MDFKIKQGVCLGNFKIILTLKSRDYKLLECQQSAWCFGFFFKQNSNFNTLSNPIFGYVFNILLNHQVWVWSGLNAAYGIVTDSSPFAFKPVLFCEGDYKENSFQTSGIKGKLSVEVLAQRLWGYIMLNDKFSETFK